MHQNLRLSDTELFQTSAVFQLLPDVTPVFLLESKSGFKSVMQLVDTSRRCIYGLWVMQIYLLIYILHVVHQSQLSPPNE
jgi:hypothetical protein